MSRTKKIVFLVVAVVLAAVAFWWTTIKKGVVRNAVTKAVQKKTDSLYRITYDTSEVDELNGDVFLKNVKIALDSAQWVKRMREDSMPTVTIALQVGKITIKGLKELKLLSNRSLDVNSIVLENPVFRLDQWKRKDSSAAKYNDTLEIYQRLVGNFDFLRAKHIKIVNGHFSLLDQLHKEVFSANGINIDVDDFLVDSAHNYNSVLSYFVKQTRASVKGIAGSNVRTGKLVYDSRERSIQIDSLSIMSNTPVQCRSVVISGLATEAFVYSGALNATKIMLRQPEVMIKPSNKRGPKQAGMALPDARIDSLQVQQASVTVLSRKTKPVYIKSIDLLLRNIKVANGKFPLSDYLTPASLAFQIGSVRVPAGFHIVDLSNLRFPSQGDRISIDRMQMKPTITRQQLKDRIGKQADMYTINASHIVLDGFNLQKIFRDDPSIDIKRVSMQLNLHVFDDKTLPVDSVKKGRGRFPYEALMLSKVPINIRAIEVEHSRIAYEEQAPKTGMNGTIFFAELNGKATNITNIPALLAKDNVMQIDASALVMGAGRLQSHWSIPVNSPNVEFRITGEVAPFPVTALSPPFESLSLTKLRSGFVDKMVFEINGNRQGSTGNLLLKYRDLKVEMLRKNKEDSLEKKGLISFLANADIRNNNNSDKPKDYTYKRDRYKSMFNLLWKSIFEGGKKTILIIH